MSLPLGPDKKILVVEDFKTSRLMQVKVLKDLGYQNILQAEDGEQGIATLEAEPDVGLVISDWNMPNKSGYELLQWVRTQSAVKDIPFLMATAQGEKKQAAKAVEAGVSGFITKPFGPKELQTAINDIFTGKAPGQAKPRAEEKTLEASGKLRLNVGHIQITDHLALGVMKHLIDQNKLRPKYFELNTMCMPGWNPVQRNLESGDLDMAFILAPIAMDLFAYKAPVKLLLFAHRGGSIFVKNVRGKKGRALKEFFFEKTIYIPHMLSIHHMLSYIFLTELGLKPGLVGQQGVNVFFEVVPPIKMQPGLAQNPQVAGFMVAEPLGSKAVSAEDAEHLFISGEFWPGHPCCVLTARDEIIQKFPDAVQEFTSMLVQAGEYVNRRPQEAAEIGVNFLDPEKKLGLNPAVLNSVLTEDQGIATDELFPVPADLDRIQRFMSEQMGIGSIIDLSRFVEPRFAEKACGRSLATVLTSADQAPDLMSDLTPVNSLIEKGMRRVVDRDLFKGEEDEDTLKDKYLVFGIGGEDYGFEVRHVLEIIVIQKITDVPDMPHYVKGLINLRGQVLPVMDIRLRFGYEQRPYDERTCIVVVQTDDAPVGVVVDMVTAVMDIPEENTSGPPSISRGTANRFIKAMARVDEKVAVILDVEKLLYGTKKARKRESAA